MPLPPSTVNLKRPRHEEPVDTFYVQKENREFKRTRIETAFRYRRVKNEAVINVESQQNTRASTGTVHNNTDALKAPTIRSTLPPTDDTSDVEKLPLEGILATTLRAVGDVKISSIRPVKGGGTGGQQSSQIVREVRKFHLRRNAPSSSGPFPYKPSHGSVQKRTRGHRKEVPVFSKKPKKRLGTNAVHGSKAALLLQSDSYSFRTPNKANEDTKYATNNLSSVGTGRGGKEADLMKLAAELHEFALAETRGDSRDALVRSTDLRPTRPPGRRLKVQPKSTPQRYHERCGDSEVIGDVSADEGLLAPNDDEDDDGDYVMETYVREPNLHLDIIMVSNGEDNVVSTLLSHHMGDVGLLVIPEEDLGEWELYQEDESSDKEWESDGDDENAEDYYLNDYPEDEVDSDDEYGRGAYGYRRGASDDEEFDQDSGSWSDEEPKPSWKNGLRAMT